MPIPIRRKPATSKDHARCYFLLARDCPGGLAFIPECYGGVSRGPEGCICCDKNMSVSDMKQRIETLKDEIEDLSREIATHETVSD